MTVITTPRIGTFCWPELCTSDATLSKQFYSDLFGWHSNDIHMPDGDYTTFNLGGKGVGAMYQMAEDRKAVGVLPHWNSYVVVADAAETVRNAAALGGKVLMESVEMDGEFMANLQDPTGAKFSIWQATKQPHPTLLNEIGSLSWTELCTRDVEKASTFYSKLFGWDPQPYEGGPMPYTMFDLPGADQPIGGMFEMTDEMPGDSRWIPYFQVGDADKTVQRAVEIGGTITVPLTDIPNIGRMAMIADPQGAEFSIIKFVSM